MIRKNYFALILALCALAFIACSNSTGGDGPFISIGTNLTVSGAPVTRFGDGDPEINDQNLPADIVFTDIITMDYHTITMGAAIGGTPKVEIIDGLANISLGEPKNPMTISDQFDGGTIPPTVDVHGGEDVKMFVFSAFYAEVPLANIFPEYVGDPGIDDPFPAMLVLVSNDFLFAVPSFVWFVWCEDNFTMDGYELHGGQKTTWDINAKKGWNIMRLTYNGGSEAFFETIGLDEIDDYIWVVTLNGSP